MHEKKTFGELKTLFGVVSRCAERLAHRQTILSAHQNKVVAAHGYRRMAHLSVASARRISTAT